MPSSPRAQPELRSQVLECLLLGLLAFLAALGVSARVFEGGRITGDEGSYLFQAHAFADGLLRRDPGLFGDYLAHDMIILHDQAGWLSRYPPGHSLWLVPGVWMGWPQLMSAVAALLTTMALYGVGRILHMPRLLLPALVMLSPFFVLLHGTLLSHTSGMAASAGMLFFYMRWRQNRTMGWALASGLCWAFLFLNRTWTASLLALPFAIDSLNELRREWRKPLAWAGTALFAVAALMGVLLYLRYNKLTTGHSRLPTYLLYESSENLGFGIRRTQGGEIYQVNHTLQRGLGFFWKNLRRLDRWMLGTPAGTLIAWLGLAAHGWSRRWSGLLLFCAVIVPLGYVAFWYEGVSTVGPIYLAEILPHTLILGGLGLSRIWRRMESSLRLLRNLLFAVGAVALLVSSLRFTIQRARDIRAKFSPWWSLEARIRALPRPSLLLLTSDSLDRDTRNYLQLNERGLDSDILRLQVPRGEREGVVACFPERTAWELVATPQGVEPRRIEPRSLQLRRDGANAQLSRGSAENDGAFRRAIAGKHRPGFLFWGWYNFLPPGDYECRFDMIWENVTTDAPLRIEVMADFGTTSLGERNLATDLEPPVIRFRTDRILRVEPRVHYGGSGSVLLRAVEIQPMANP